MTKTIRMQTTMVKDGTVEVPVITLNTISVPDHDGGSYASRLESSFSWDGHTRSKVPHHLRTWTPPAHVRKIRQRIEAALEEGIPDQRRRAIRNQDFGILDDRWIAEIAQGEEVERPFWTWSRKKSGEARVAICLDDAVASCQSKTLMEARMTLALGLAAALEALDYEVSVTAATLDKPMSKGGYGGRARTQPKNAQVIATVLKDESEPFVESGMAYFADTGLRRLMLCWVDKGDGYCSPLSNDEWRELTDADLFVYVGPDRRGAINSQGLPRGVQVGPTGEDSLRLTVNGPRDVDSAVSKLETFFQNLCGE